MNSWWRVVTLGAAGLALQAVAGDAAVLRLYEMRTETGMPHLDEPLRYAAVTEQRCLDITDLSGAFWMLGNVSLQDCRLVKTAQTAHAASYTLACDGGHGTSGSAEWELGAETLRGTLDVKLGAKNMTFYQRISARSLGACH